MNTGMRIHNGDGKGEFIPDNYYTEKLLEMAKPHLVYDFGHSPQPTIRDRIRYPLYVVKTRIKRAINALFGNFDDYYD